MTVAAATAKAGPYTGNDSASSFAFSFKVFADADIRVVKTVIASGAESDFVLNTDYTVTRNVDQDANPGGSVTYKVGGVTTALPSTLKLTIVGDFDYAQPTDIPNGGSFFASVIETALDRITMLIKQLKEQSSRALVFPVSAEDPTTDLPTDRASKYLAFDADGNPVASAGTPAADIVTPFMETVLDDTTAAAARTTLDAQEDVLTTIGDSIVATTAGAAARLAAAASVAAHATTMNLWAARENVLTGGAVTITDIADAPYAGAVTWVKMNAAHVWDDGAVFSVQGGADYTAAANDWVRIYATTVSTFEVTVFKKSGAPATPSRSRQVFTSGTAQTYTTPTGCTAINVRMVGGGGGGGAVATNAGAAGVASTWSGGSLSAGGGGGGAAAAGAPGAGGVSANGDINIPGGAGCGCFAQGGASNDTAPGGFGGNGAFGGGGTGDDNAAGGNGSTNSGGGGAGGGVGAAASGGAGGGAGGYVEKLITSPAATYTYTVGTGGAGGAAGTTAGGDGAAGIIIVDEFYS